MKTYPIKNVRRFNGKRFYLMMVDTKPKLRQAKRMSRGIFLTRIVKDRLYSRKK